MHGQLNSDLPEELERIITKALEKDREMRYQTAFDLRAVLKRLHRNTESKRETNIREAKASHVLESTPHRVTGGKRLALVGIITVLLVGLGLGWYTWRRERPQPEIKQRQLTTNSFEMPVIAAAISPDGKYLAFSDETGIYLKFIDTGERHSLTIPVDLKVSHLSWFPDGTKLLASGVAGKEKVSTVWKISILDLQTSAGPAFRRTYGCESRRRGPGLIYEKMSKLQEASRRFESARMALLP